MYSRTYTAHKTIDLQASSYAMMSPEHEVSSFGGDPSGPRPVERVGLSSLWFAKVLGRDIARAYEFWQSIPVSDYTSFQTGSSYMHFGATCVPSLLRCSFTRHSHIVATPSFLHSGTGRMDLTFSFLVTIVRFMLQMAEWDILQITRNISYITMRAAESSTFLDFWSLPRYRGSIAAASARHGQKR